MLALTLIPYLDIPDRIFLIEEPENGIHPQAVETVFQALANAGDCQILCATHSPVFLSLAEHGADSLLRPDSGGRHGHRLWRQAPKAFRVEA